TGVSSYDQKQLYDPANPLNPATLYGAMIASRTPGDAASGIPPGTPSKNDKPFKGLATGVVAPGSTQFPAGSGIDDTLLRGYPGDPTRRLFEVTPTSRPPAPGVPAPLDHPYLKSELINKIFNNVTTRSNVFAVWMTVGFFEVADESVQPPRLGAELKRDVNRHIRHRMF